MAIIQDKELSLVSDEDLLFLLKENKEEVLSELYKRYEKLIFFKARSILKDEHKAMDLTHDIFIKIFTNLSQFKGRSRFSLWVHSITFNTTMKYINAQKKVAFFAWQENDELIDESEIDINNKVLYDVNLDKLENGLKKLKEDERYLLYMKYTDDLSIKEICEVTGMKESNIKMRLKRTRDKLAQIMG
jgi:RNA polymerase sigma-70 factor (ECF subfamily)